MVGRQHTALTPGLAVVVSSWGRVLLPLQPWRTNAPLTRLMKWLEVGEAGLATSLRERVVMIGVAASPPRRMAAAVDAATSPSEPLLLSLAPDVRWFSCFQSFATSQLACQSYCRSEPPPLLCRRYGRSAHHQFRNIIATASTKNLPSIPSAHGHASSSLSLQCPSSPSSASCAVPWCG